MKESEYCKLDIDYEADIDTVLNKREEVINQFKSAKIPGFRQNKATKEVVKFHFGKEIDARLKQELANDALQNVISEKNIKPFGYPNFTSVELNGEKFTCKFTLHKRPDFELATYKGFDIPKPKLPQIEELAQKIVQELRTKHGKTTPYTENDFVQMGDQIIIDCKTFINNEPIERLTFSGEILNVGRINVPGFSENILGMQCNDNREFELSIPENYGGDLAGKTVKFEVKLLMGSKIEDAILDDELASKIGLTNVNDLMTNAVSIASSRISELDNEQVFNQISKRLIENHTFKIPYWISTAEAKFNANTNKLEWDKLTDEEKESIIKHAANNVKLSMILEKVREQEPDAQLTQDEMLGIAKNNISQFTKEPEKVFQDLISSGQLSVFLNRIKDEYTLDFIKKNSNIIE